MSVLYYLSCGLKVYKFSQKIFSLEDSFTFLLLLSESEYFRLWLQTSSFSLFSCLAENEDIFTNAIAYSTLLLINSLSLCPNFCSSGEMMNVAPKEADFLTTVVSSRSIKTLDKMNGKM